MTVVLYAVIVEGPGDAALARLRLPLRWIAWLRSAVAEESVELEEAMRAPQGTAARRRGCRAGAGGGGRGERDDGACRVGTWELVSPYPRSSLAAWCWRPSRACPTRSRLSIWRPGAGGAATLSTALNSNTLNVALSLVLPAAVIGLGRPSGQATLITAWYIGLTAVTLAFAYRDRGIRRGTGIAIIAAYAPLHRLRPDHRARDSLD